MNAKRDERKNVRALTVLVTAVGLLSSGCSFHFSASTKTGADAKSSKRSKASGGSSESRGDQGSSKDDSKKEARTKSSSSGDGKSGARGSVSIKGSTDGSFVFRSKSRTKDISRSSKGDDFAATDLVGGGAGVSGSAGGDGRSQGGGKSQGGGSATGSANGSGKTSSTSGGGKDKGGKPTEKAGGGVLSDGDGKKSSAGSQPKNEGKKETSAGKEDKKDYASGSAQVESAKRRRSEKAGEGRENSQPAESEKAGAGREKNAQKTSGKSSEKATTKASSKKDKDAGKKVVVIDPPQKPPENVFGYDTPVRGCFEGVVYPLAPQTKRLPLDFGKLSGISVVYACEWDIPVRAWSQGFPGVADRFEWFALQYKGSFAVDKAGTWEFRISSDDGAKLYIDGKLLIDNDGIHPPQERKAKVQLSRGDHEMVLEYYQGPRYHINLQLFATPPGEKEGIFSVR